MAAKVIKQLTDHPGFHGDSMAAREWLETTELMMEMIMDDTADDKKDKAEKYFVFALRNKLKDDAKDWYRSQFNTAETPGYEDFKTRFTLEYLGEANRSLLWTRWNQEEMKMDDTVDGFFARLRRLRATTDITKEAIKNKFLSGLRPELRDEMRLKLAEDPELDTEKLRRLATVRWDLIMKRQQMTVMAASVRGHNNREETRKCFNCGKIGHLAKDCRSTRRETRTCHYCGKIGHLKKDLPQTEGRSSRIWAESGGNHGNPEQYDYSPRPHPHHYCRHPLQRCPRQWSTGERDDREEDAPTQPRPDPTPHTLGVGWDRYRPGYGNG